MKALIPVAGAGTKLRPLTYTQPKPLIPVAGKPIMAYIIDQLLSVGVDEFIFVIGYLGEKIRNYVREAYPDLDATFVVQQKREGSGHAIWTARHELENTDELIIFFGDTIVDLDFDQMLGTDVSCVAVSKVRDPRDFGVVEYGDNGFVKHAVEKPRIPKSNMAMVGLYKILDVPALLEALEYNLHNDLRTADEFFLTDALERMVSRGTRLCTIEVKSWFDCGKKQILLETNATLLDREGYASQDLPAFYNSIIVHPVHIGENCDITNSIIGPHVTIGNNTTIDAAILRNSIIGNYSAIRETVLHNSIIGNDTSITGHRQSLNLGDNTEIDFSGRG